MIRSFVTPRSKQRQIAWGLRFSSNQSVELLLDNKSPLAAKPQSILMPQAIIQPPELKSFIPHEYTAPGYSASRSFNFKSLVESFCGNTLNALTLGRAEVFASHFLVGSNCSKNNYIICGNVTAMLESRGSSPLSTALAVNEPVHDLHWLNSSAIFAATGQGNMQLFKISENRSIIEPSVILSDIHSDYICETAVKPFQSYQLASGGWDKRLCITDLEAQQLICCKDTESSITSVKWSKWNQGECISITTDEGYYKLYDSRHSLRGQAAWETNLGKIKPFCHERYTDHHILLGDADGGIHHMDMRYDRNKAITCSIVDPHVQGVGHIEYNDSSSAFVASGYTDFTVWKQDVNQRAHVWSHSIDGSTSIVNTNGFSICSVFFDHDTILSTTSSGYVSTFVQGFF